MPVPVAFNSIVTLLTLLQDAFVWGSLQKPYGELRYLAVRTLGLMALYSETYCDAIFEVLPQVTPSSCC